MTYGIATDVPAWLRLFPDRDHYWLTAWFAYAIGQGARTPEGVLKIVQRVVERKLAWATSQTSETLCRATLLALVMHRQSALDYAKGLLER
jgi:hypothetical protein